VNTHIATLFRPRSGPHLALEGCGSGPHAAMNDGAWVAHSCLPDLGHKQAIAMPHVRQEQRSKPELDFIRATKSVYIKHGVVSTLISLLTSRITEGKKRMEKETSRTTTDFSHSLKWNHLKRKEDIKSEDLSRGGLNNSTNSITSFTYSITNQTDFISVRLLQKILLKINRGLTLCFIWSHQNIRISEGENRNWLPLWRSAIVLLNIFFSGLFDDWQFKALLGIPIFCIIINVFTNHFWSI